MVKTGANIDQKNESGWSCIHISARQNYIDFVKFLIMKNCRINDINDNLKTPLLVSARHGKKHLIFYFVLVNFFVIKYRYFLAGHHKLARVLLNANADVSLRNKV